MKAHLEVVDHWCADPSCTSSGPKKGRCTFARKIRVLYDERSGGGVFESLDEALRHLNECGVQVDGEEISECRKYLTS